MAMKRTINVGFRGPGGKMEKQGFVVPAEVVKGDRDVIEELEKNDALKKHIYLDMSAVIWAQIGDPYDDAPGSKRVQFG